MKAKSSWQRQAAAACTALLFCGPAAAQEVPQQLTLEEAIRIALLRSPSHLRILNDMDVEDARVRASYGAFLPSMSLNAGFSSTYRETKRTEDQFGRPLTSPEAVVSKTSGGSQSISLGSITLFDGGRQFRNVDIAKTSRTSKEAEIAGAELDLRASVTRLYYAAVSAERRIELEQQLLATAKERLELTQKQFRIAAAKQTAVLGAQGEVLAREQQLLNAQSGARKARIELLEAMGIEAEPTFVLASELPREIDPASLDVSALITRAQNSHPVVRQQTAAFQIQQKNAANARSLRLPTLSLGLPSYSLSSSETGLWDAWGNLGAPNNSFTFGVSLSLPVFTRFNNSSQIAQSNAAAEDARYNLQFVRMQVANDVKAAFIDLDVAFRGIRNAEEQARLTSLRLELAQEEYRAGAISFTELQQIIQSNDQAQRSALDARFGTYLNALVALERSVGGPVSTGN
jgi:outer membrane protein